MTVIPVQIILLFLLQTTTNALTRHTVCLNRWTCVFVGWLVCVCSRGSIQVSVVEPCMNAVRAVDCSFFSLHVAFNLILIEWKKMRQKKTQKHHKIVNWHCTVMADDRRLKLDFWPLAKKWPKKISSKTENKSQWKSEKNAFLNFQFMHNIHSPRKKTDNFFLDLVVQYRYIDS